MGTTGCKGRRKMKIKRGLRTKGEAERKKEKQRVKTKKIKRKLEKIHRKWKKKRVK